MRKPKLIYYHDSRHYLLYRLDPPMSFHQFRMPVDELLGTPVDTLVYGLAMGTTFLHDTKVGTKFGEKAYEHNHGTVWWRAAANLESGLERNIDPLKVVIDRAHEKGMQVICSLRINDTGAPEGSNYNVGRLKYENANVMIGEEDPNNPHISTAMDFARQDVQEERLAVIEEVCDRYGADGIEIDEYVRVFFKPSQVQQNIPVLTDFMRKVRKLLDSIGQQRGNKRLGIALRTHPNYESALAVGMDVKTWLKEGLVDIVVPHADETMFNPEPAFTEMARDAHDAGAWLYAPVGRHPYDDRYHEPTTEMYRAAGANFTAAGADGLYLADLAWPRNPAVYEVLREMADPDIYARKTKHYPAAQQSTRPDPYLPKRYLPRPLEKDKTVRVCITVSDDFNSAIADGELKSVTLGLRFVLHIPLDQYAVKFNGRTLSMDDAEVSTFYGGIVPYMHTKMGLDVRINTHHWFYLDIPHDLVRKGENVIEVTMTKRYDQYIDNRVLMSAEIWTRYVEPPITIGGQM